MGKEGGASSRGSLSTPRLPTRLPSDLAQALPLAWALPIPRIPQGCPTRHSHCLESGVTFSISSMKFFRNSVLLSEAFRSLQYSLGMGGGEKSGLGGLDRAERRGFPTGVLSRMLRCPSLSEGQVYAYRWQQLHAWQAPRSD